MAETFTSEDEVTSTLEHKETTVIPSGMLILCMLGNFVCFFVVYGFFLKLTFSKKSFRNTIRMSNSLDPDQARQFIGSDLGPNCLQRLSADDKSRH